MNEYSTFVKSLARLFAAGRIGIADIAARVEAGKIGGEEFEYITGEVYGA